MALRNGSGSSPKAIATAERHREWIELRRAGMSELEIASRYGVSQQSVSKVLLGHVRDLPAAQAADFRRSHLERLNQMREMAMKAVAVATTNPQILRALRVWEKIDHREAKMLGLYDIRWDRVSPTAESNSPANTNLPPDVDLEELQKIMELDPSLAANDSERPDPASAADHSHSPSEFRLPPAGAAIDLEKLRKLQEVDPIVETDNVQRRRPDSGSQP